MDYNAFMLTETVSMLILTASTWAVIVSMYVVHALYMLLKTEKSLRSQIPTEYRLSKLKQKSEKNRVYPVSETPLPGFRNMKECFLHRSEIFLK